MTPDALLVDTNILIRSVQTQDQRYQIVKESLAKLVKAKTTLYYTSQNLGEFWNTITRPSTATDMGRLHRKRT